ncbi:hypothetical protein [Sphingomonas sp. T9W2]|uniref:hypothetical protein n=1 Tax=Sphingomonas sp. T9W2 TaxID=3143183 RepID=UPI0031F4C45D
MTREERAEAVVVELLDADPGYTVAALKAALIAFADAEAAAMRGFVSLVASLTLSDEMAPDTPCEDAWMTMDGLIRRARALPATGEVGR